MDRLIYPDNNNVAVDARFGRGSTTGNWGICAALSGLFIANVPTSVPATSRPAKARAQIIYGANVMQSKIRGAAGFDYRKGIFERCGITMESGIDFSMDDAIAYMLRGNTSYYVALSSGPGEGHAIGVVNRVRNWPLTYIYDPNIGLSECNDVSDVYRRMKAILFNIGWGVSARFAVYAIADD